MNGFPYYRIPFSKNEGSTSKVLVSSFGRLYCSFCRKLLLDSNEDGVFPDICPICKGTLDYSILDELRNNPIQIDN